MCESKFKVGEISENHSKWCEKKGCETKQKVSENSHGKLSQDL